ncbi:MAG: acyl-ACP--UDP-N-acetylglucosamine O-acyltransferase [Pseudomonadota bacterium]|nr:acyl-ACP--UDP-N-acetylglucosamine O-acyltransferase [Pseudomonadota bacterium]
MIDPRAVIDPSAKLADDVSVGPFSVIGPSVSVGRGTWIGPHVVINGPARIGEDNRIFQFASLGEIPQDKKFRGEDSELVIGDRNTIREYVTINRGTALDKGKTMVGNENWIMAYVHIAHDCQVGSRTIFSNGATLAGHVQVGDQAILGGFTLVHQFCRIGTHAFCGMGTALNRDLPPYVMASGNLARPFGLNREGLKRDGVASDTVRALQRAYKALVRVGMVPEDERAQIDDLRREHAEVERFAAFIETSTRGIVRDAD